MPVFENGGAWPPTAFRSRTCQVPTICEPLAGNVYAVEPGLSGDVQVGFAGTGGFGTMVSSALEQSTVDLASELTTMIESRAQLHGELEGVPDRRRAHGRAGQSEALT